MGSFFELGERDHLGSENQLVKIGKLINWSKLLPVLGNVHTEDGPRGYDPLKMFNAVLLGQ